MNKNPVKVVQEKPAPAPVLPQKELPKPVTAKVKDNQVNDNRFFLLCLKFKTIKSRLFITFLQTVSILRKAEEVKRKVVLQQTDDGNNGAGKTN